MGALSLLGGVLAGLLAAAGPHAGWSGIALTGSTFVLLTRLRHCVWLRSLAMGMFGMALASLSVARWQEMRLAPGGADSRVLLEGTIRGVPTRDGAEWRFDADVTLVGQTPDPRLRRARLTWRNAPVAPRAGERWRWVVRLSHAAELHNFAGIDAERIAMRDRVHITGRILPAALNTRLALARTSVDTLRARIALRIADGVADPHTAGLITALSVGITSGVSTDQWRVFNATATTHLVAISGLHVTLFALLAFGVARVAWRWLRIPGIEREPFAILLGLCAAGGYSLLAGFSVPTQRTWLMLAIFAMARLGARQVGASRTWSMALIAVLLLDVFAPLGAGFWLSFVAVGVLLLMDTSSLVRETRLRAFLRLQLAVTLALAPLTFAVFGGVSVVGVAVNLVAIPVVSFGFVPLVLAGALAALLIPAASPYVFALAAGLHDLLWPLLVWAADLDGAQWRVHPPAWWFAFAAPAALLLLLRWPLPFRLTAAGVALPLLFAPTRLPEPGTVRISVLDAGRGAAVLVATNSRLLLFDTGDAWNTHGTRAARVVIPALEAMGRRRLDLLVLPGLDADRARGAALLASEGEVGRILVGGGWPATRLPAAACEDARFEWDGVDFEIFAAGPSGRHCLMRVAVGERAVLLGGDLDTAAERRGEVIVLHQPSAHGSSPKWIEASAGLAVRVIAAGGMPGTETRARVLARWRRTGVAVFDTTRDGAIEFSFGTQGVFSFATARSARYPFAWRRFK